MAPTHWTEMLARERITDLRREAERERLARLALSQAGGGRIRRDRPVAGQRRARALLAWLRQRLRRTGPWALRPGGERP
jgi:hypothetical protein